MKGRKINSEQNKFIDFGDFYNDCIGDVVFCYRGIIIGFWIYVEDGKDIDILYIVERENDRGMIIFYEVFIFLLMVWIYLIYEYG